ncbi:histidine phosphatase family protein [Salipiger abyssi]|uniref:histidine phosphatase family protein n=1 Tax=Salipiger abyssi TaxID=1250539 RepID=UPI001A8E5A20|nr:histidine phosphatase family protein [Salipiger abyssi]MBN9887685.1 histidine phosphatase family protein [Salipiger abyssi]
MKELLFISHAEVQIDPGVPVPDWGLSDKGRARHEAFSERCTGVTAIYCSGERKARDGADILEKCIEVTPQVIEILHENDRSATGYLPGPEFEAMADAFFARPQESVRGWERAVDAQARIVAALHEIEARERDREGDVAVIAHGGVGALLRAHLLGAEISRIHDQRARGGNVLRIALPGWRLVEGWVPMEQVAWDER